MSKVYKSITLLLITALLLILPGLAAAETTPAEVRPTDAAGPSEGAAADTEADTETDKKGDTEASAPTTGDTTSSEDKPSAEDKPSPGDENKTPAPVQPTLPQSLTVSFFDPVNNSNHPTKVTPVSTTLSGSPLVGDVPAMAVSGRTLVPIRLISESLNAAVNWSKEDNTVTVSLKNKTIVLTIGSRTAFINNVPVPVPDDVSVSLVTYDGTARTMVPLRFITENLSATVNYDAAVRNVDILPPAENTDDDEDNTAAEPFRPVGVGDDNRMIRRVVIDAGHGGKDPGTSSNGRTEKSITLSVALKLQAQLEDAGFEVVMSRTDDTYPELIDRAGLTRKYNAPVFVSLHCNAAENIKSANGIETYAAPGDTKDAELAGYLQKRLIAATQAKDRGVKTSRLVVLTQNPAPAALVELGFMSNTQECAKLANDAYQQTLAKAICQGIEDFFAAN